MSLLAILSAAIPTLASALSVPTHINEAPAVEFKKLAGFCRTSKWEAGDFKLVSLDRVECEAECVKSDECVAFEWLPNRILFGCELHMEEIDRSLFNPESEEQNAECYIKQIMSPPVCASDVSKCPGVNLYVSRDPLNECDFMYDKCPDVQPKPEYSSIVYGTCQSNGLLPVESKEDCVAAVSSLGFGIKYDYSNWKYPDTVDGCSTRGENQLFHNPTGTCDHDNGSDSKLFRGCKCSDLNPCICMKATDTKVTGSYYEADGGEDCPTPQKITTEAECRAAGDAIGRPFHSVGNDAGTINGDHGRPSGCFWDQNGYTYLNTNAIGWGNDGSQWSGVGGLCSRGYYKAVGGEDCVGSHKITSEAGCKAAASAIGLPFNKVVDDAGSKNGDHGRPSGCFWDQNGYTYFNKNEVGWANDDYQWGGVGGLCF